MLTLDKLSFSYGKKEILRELSYVFPEHAAVAITGSSGIGKTTLLHLIAGLLTPASGQIHCDLNRPAFIFQEPRLFPWLTALDNVRLIGGDDGRAAELLDLLLEDPDAKHLYPNELSGGMKQRVSIARALAYEGDLILMDEPFRGLDPQTRGRVAARFFEMSAGKTVLMVTHDQNELPYCKQILRLEGDPASRLILEKSSISQFE